MGGEGEGLAAAPGQRSEPPQPPPPDPGTAPHGSPSRPRSGGAPRGGAGPARPPAPPGWGVPGRRFRLARGPTRRRRCGGGSMLSPRERGGDLARFYTVTEPRRHPRGHTVYKVTARVSQRPAGPRPPPPPPCRLPGRRPAPCLPRSPIRPGPPVVRSLKPLLCAEWSLWLGCRWGSSPPCADRAGRDVETPLRDTGGREGGREGGDVVPSCQLVAHVALALPQMRCAINCQFLSCLLQGIGK